MKIRGRRKLNVALGRIGRETRKEVMRALHRGGLLIEAEAIDSIKTITTGYKQVPSRGSSKKMHEVSAPGLAPNADIGELDQSITTVPLPDKLRVEVGANVPQAVHLELGTSKMAPRPFMSPAFDKQKKRIIADVRAAAQRGIRRGNR